MVSPVTQTPQTTKTSIFYVNDEHAQITNMEKLKSASDTFDTFIPSYTKDAVGSEKTGPFTPDKLKFSSGDFALGSNKPLNKLAVYTQNAMGLMATAGGNHEFDMHKNDVVEVLKDNNYKILAMNVEIPQTSRENKEIQNEITNSYIQDVNGTKYGVIGLMPFDFNFHVTRQDEYGDFHMKSVEETIPLIQREIDNLQKQGVNKIILLSHAGYDVDVKLAQQVEGIDIILGGHTHDLIKGITEGKNLFYSPKTGAPTIITQAGKDGNYFGVLNVEFDENGVIKTAQNNVQKTEDFSKNPVIKFFTDKFLGKPEVIGTVKSVPKYSISLVEENPGADFIEDAVRKQMGTDLAITNSGNIRSKFEVGPFTDRDVSEIIPFKNKMCIVPLSEKEIVDMIKHGADSMADENNMPGIIQVSGMKYTISKSGELKEAIIIDKDGKENPIDLNNPRTDKTYRVALDSYLTSGGNGYLPNKMDSVEQKFDFDKVKVIKDYMKNTNEPVEIKTDGRIKIVDG